MCLIKGFHFKSQMWKGISIRMRKAKLDYKRWIPSTGQFWKWKRNSSVFKYVRILAAPVANWSGSLLPTPSGLGNLARCRWDRLWKSLFLHLQVLLWELGLLLFEYLRVCTLHYPLIQLHSAHHSLLIQDHPLARPFSRPTADCREELSSKIFTSCGQTAAVEVFI